MKTIKVLLISVAFAMMLCAGASAATIDVVSTSGIWTSATPAANAFGVGTNEIKWGTPGASQSGYKFVGVPPPVQDNVAEGVLFLLGTLTHNNFPITSGTSITAAGRWSDTTTCAPRDRR